MSVTIARALASKGQGPYGAQLVRAIRTQLGDKQPRLIFLFFSVHEPAEQLTSELTQAFPSAQLVSASTAGEFTDAGESDGGGAAVMALAGDFAVTARMATGLRKNLDGVVSEVL